MSTVKTKMEDVADVNIDQVRHNLSNWEDNRSPLSPLTHQERDSIIEVTSVSGFRALPSGILNEDSKSDVLETARGGPDTDSTRQINLPDSLARLQLQEIKVESSQQVRIMHNCSCYRTIEVKPLR